MDPILVLRSIVLPFRTAYRVEETGRSRVKKIRILLAIRPRMMREILKTLFERQEDMEVVGEVLAPVELLVAVREMEADTVVLALRDFEKLGVHSNLLAEFPNVTILALASKGEAAFIEQLCHRRLEIANPSKDTILNALRQANRAPCREEEEMEKGHSH